mmetsp:Transcript_9311/g.31745  ORF Transcript_9311/g.31745 Transcript_9311/m.31745 type:complete len:375 (+) Transcript_9311:1997-3121(+)
MRRTRPLNLATTRNVLPLTPPPNFWPRCSSYVSKGVVLNSSSSSFGSTTRSFMYAGGPSSSSSAKSASWSIHTSEAPRFFLRFLGTTTCRMAPNTPAPVSSGPALDSTSLCRSAGSMVASGSSSRSRSRLAATSSRPRRKSGSSSGAPSPSGPPLASSAPPSPSAAAPSPSMPSTTFAPAICSLLAKSSICGGLYVADHGSFASRGMMPWPTTGLLKPPRRVSLARILRGGAKMAFSGIITGRMMRSRKLGLAALGFLDVSVTAICLPEAVSTSNSRKGSCMGRKWYGTMSRQPSAIISRYIWRSEGAMGGGSGSTWSGVVLRTSCAETRISPSVSPASSKNRGYHLGSGNRDASAEGSSTTKASCRLRKNMPR